MNGVMANLAMNRPDRAPLSNPIAMPPAMPRRMAGAAGTGSFIEEQAKRLGCPLDDYAERVENAPAPMASDRCTVFMERDLNHYLMAGYSTNEILAAVLHSTRENYLTKVAVKGYIGRKIFFQGATAKNKALIAAFEQKLKRPEVDQKIKEAIQSGRASAPSR